MAKEPAGSQRTPHPQSPFFPNSLMVQVATNQGWRVGVEGANLDAFSQHLNGCSSPMGKKTEWRRAAEL
ncbi:hypothetical protein BS78_06G180500 [Paspalum vaginatum]|nr:hypothetical protein BS78_06G180500 [Paspalum vaginatum]